ncbi:MAG: hypothetical protein R6W68_11415 [Ignavibacteriaceae bacterium]
MNIINRLNQVEKKADAKRMVVNNYTMQPDETMKDARLKAKELGDAIIYITVYPDDVNYHKIKYIDSLGDSKFKELHETKSLNQILKEHRDTITDADELRKWDSKPGEIC